MLDDAGAQWLAHTAGTRAAAERAKAELASRHADDTAPEQRVTAADWLAAHRAAIFDNEQNRQITETDIARQPDDTAHSIVDHEAAGDEVAVDGRQVDEGQVDQGQVDQGQVDEERADVEPADEVPADRGRDVAHDAPEVRGPDLREVAAAEPAPVAEDDVRLPTAGETSAAVERANRALAEMRSRDDADQREAAEHRSGQLTTWHTSDHAAVEHEAAERDEADDNVEFEPVGVDAGGPP